MDNNNKSEQSFLTIKFCLVRHGQTEDNIKETISGHRSTKLTVKGQRQAQMLGQYFIKSNHKFDKIYVSNLERTMTTFSIICKVCKKLSEIPVQYSNQVRQKSGGELQGLPKITTFQKSQQQGVPFRQYRPKGGQSFEDLNRRVWKFLQSVLLQNIQNSKSLKSEQMETVERNILIVTHGGFIREFYNIMNQINGDNIEHDQTVSNCSVNQFVIKMNFPIQGQTKQIIKNNLTMRVI